MSADIRVRSHHHVQLLRKSVEHFFLFSIPYFYILTETSAVGGGDEADLDGGPARVEAVGEPHQDLREFSTDVGRSDLEADFFSELKCHD